jgi:hypothetical protein
LDLIAFATSATACNPDEQSLSIAYKGVVSGMPAKNYAILEEVDPAPG